MSEGLTRASSEVVVLANQEVLGDLIRGTDESTDTGSYLGDPLVSPPQRHSYPCITALCSQNVTPPRPPRRTDSLDSTGSLRECPLHDQNEQHEEPGDEYDHHKFRQLLSGSDSDNNKLSFDFEDPMMLPAVSSRKSFASAPPKLPNRVGSDDDDDLQLPSIDRRKSEPCSIFWPTRPVRSRRRKCRIQDRIESENYSSCMTPPRLPGRTGRYCSITSNNETTPDDPTFSLSTPNSKSSGAPRRPRRELSPMSGNMIRSIFNSSYRREKERNNDADRLDEHMVNNPPVAKMAAPVSTSADETPRQHRIRKPPMRAYTFDCMNMFDGKDALSKLTIKEGQSRKDIFMSMMTMNTSLSDEETTQQSIATVIVPSVADLNASMASVLSIPSWPKPRRTRVPPGRSKTFCVSQTFKLSTTTLTRLSN